jgi:cyclopropane fatty-acyl-phospholipid synthase-like methyltransferase
MINILIKSLFDTYSKYHFVKKLNRHAKVLDVGCGNHSASKINYINKNIAIDGIDIIDYNVSEIDKKIMTNYYIVDSDSFNEFIYKIPHSYDAIICSHVIEHVKDYKSLLTILIKKLTKNGVLYLSFPNQKSAYFPKRKGTLNFYDDLTHVNLPDLQAIQEVLTKNNATVVKSALPNKKFIGFIVGMLIEPFSMALKRVLPFTWYFWGFENVFYN